MPAAVTINMSSAQRKMIFTTIMLIPCVLIESVMSMSTQDRQYVPTASPQRATSSLNSRSFNNLRPETHSNENYDAKKDQGIFDDSSRDNRESGLWSLSNPPRKQSRYYSNRYDSLATAASSQYTNIYRNRNLFSKPSWIARKRDNIESGAQVYYPSSGRIYGSRGVYETGLTTTSTDKYLKTTAEPRTAPATEVSSVTERPTTTHEMQEDTISEFDIMYHDTVKNIGNDDPKITTRFGAAYREHEVGHYSAEPTERQDKRTHFPNDDEDVIVFPTTTIFGKEYLRPTGHDPDIVTMKPLDAKDFADLRELIEARKKTEVENRNSNLNNDNHIEFKPPVCKDKTGYCIESPDYPKDALNSILESSLKPTVFQQIFGESLDNSTAIDAQELSGRIDLPQEVPLCASVEHTIYPRVAKNKEGKFMFVVNHDEYVQGVRVEKCLGENGGCQFSDGSPTGYHTSCKQKYIYKKLLAFNEGKAVTDNFRLPSCCVCYIKSSFISDRINADTSSAVTVSKKVNSKIQTRSTSTPPGSSTSANVLNTSNDDAVPTELPDSESVAQRTDKVVENTNNSTAIFNHDNSDISSSSTSKFRLDDNVAKSGSARSY